ncbi:S-adenosyl-L-methionine-dependent methyltransferase, partial [Kalaharituber pfeilii]
MGEFKDEEEEGVELDVVDRQNAFREEEEVGEEDNSSGVKTPAPGEGSKTTRKRRIMVGVRIPPLNAPKSVYEGNTYPDLPVSKERIVLRDFQQSEEVGKLEKSFVSYRLDDFTIYQTAFDKRTPMEMTCLNNLSVKAGKNILLFDGVLSDGKSRRYIEKVPFILLSIGNYNELATHTVDGAIWIQSFIGKAMGDVWYELGRPAAIYERYHKPFLWLANFSKYFIDYLYRSDDKDNPGTADVTLADFKSDFYSWIRKVHGVDLRFDKWYEEYRREDFRQVVAAHAPFLWNQAYNTDSQILTRYSIWDETLRLTAIKQAPGRLVEDTIVTPMVYECFFHIFGDKLKAMTPRQPPRPLPPGVRLELDKVAIPAPNRLPRDENDQIIRPKAGQLVDVESGDVVAVIKDVVTHWKGKSEFWYAYVQSVNKQRNKCGGSTTLDVIWLYLPEDTILGQMKYPYQNELFFSDNCNCSDAKVRLDEVLFKVPVAFFKGPGEDGSEFFIRQKFSDAESNFTTLTEEDLTCECRKPIISAFDQAKKLYEIGDTVLVESYGVDDYAKDLLEPAEIVRFDEDSQSLELRQLLRRARDFNKPDSQPNELVYTDYLMLVQPTFVYRRCHIRFFPPETRPTAPYDRGGTGDCFFIYYRRTPAGDLVPMSPPQEFHQGYDPDSIPGGCTKLNGMDLFCGGGNFGRGIEEGGAVVNKWAVDLDVPALHTYRANLRDPSTQLYLGSVNNYLRDAINGKFSATIPPPGQVDFISAGSPCQGFSNANLDRDSERSLRNSSLVASVASFVDFYRPKFALLENVHGLAQDRIKKKDGLPYNVFSQLLCALVAIGYQCQQFTLDAWSFGSCQTRTRLFVSIAAPGLRLPPRPGRSHEHPSTIRSKALFEAPNGKKFGGRELYGPCTYPFVSSGERLGDLPWLGDNHTGICTKYPDHRHSRIEGPRTRMLMTHVPKTPGCNSLRRAINQGHMPVSLDFYNPSRARLRDISRSWSRIFEDELCRTVTTAITPQCAFTGQWMHWDQHRLLTVMEVRRVQSFPDDEVLLGNASKAFRIVGNSVDRTVALAWGLAIREA